MDPSEASASAFGDKNEAVFPRYPSSLDVKFGACTEKIIDQLRALVVAIFPVRYNEKFYKDTLASGDYSKLAFYSTDILVGAICCRKEPGNKLYVMTIGVLAPYRGAGIGTAMLKAVLAQAEKDPEIDEVYLHVQVNNESAINFYHGLGFETAERIENYYKKIEPAASFLLRKNVSTQSIAA